MKRYSLIAITILFLMVIHGYIVKAQRVMENLDRGVVAVRTAENQVYIGWRMLGTDPHNVAFNVYRGSKKVNSAPIVSNTNFIDGATTNESYVIKAIINGVEEKKGSKPASVWLQQYLKVPLQVPAGGQTPDGVDYTYTPNDCSVGDVDGDGEYEIIVKWDPTNAKDNSQSGYTGNVYLDAYKLTGTHLWRIDLGKNIRAGAHYTQYLVYDFDSDGKAEVVCKTADGTIDGVGTTIGDTNADYRISASKSLGYILSGPEYLTVFNGETGKAMATTDYLPERGSVAAWGDDYGNRVDRFVAGVAYLDGEKPSIVMGRGYYTRLVRVAWDWRDGKLTHRWTFDSNSATTYAGQGNHQITVGDVDGDGKDEFFNGSSAINDDGSGLWSNRLGHGDALHMSNMDPSTKGQEIWMCHESPNSNGGIGMALIDAATGKAIWSVPGTSDVGRAMAADIDSRYEGYEMWGATGQLYSSKGEVISSTKPSMNFGLWWDGDLQRELLDGVKLDKWISSSNTVQRLITFSNYENANSNNGTKANPGLSADILGDWREEVILRSGDNSSLLLFTTVVPSTHKIYTLMHDPQYRVAVAWQNVAYNQPPHPGFYLGGGMASLPTPSIILANRTNATGIRLQGENNIDKITEDGGKLQMTAIFEPDETSDKRVVWSIEESTGRAVIDTTGIVTAISNGEVVVKAKSKQNAEIVGESTITIDFETVTAVSKINAVPFSVFPNPVSEVLFIKHDASINKIEVFSMQNKVLQPVVIDKYESTLNFSKVEKGIYLLRVHTTNDVHFAKVIKP